MTEPFQNCVDGVKDYRILAGARTRARRILEFFFGTRTNARARFLTMVRARARTMARTRVRPQPRDGARLGLC